MSDYTDSKGYIGHIEKSPGGDLLTYPESGRYRLEFGDGIQRTSMDIIFDFILNGFRMGVGLHDIYLRFAIVSRYLYLDSGEPVRHWDGSRWSGKSGTMSGDQIEPYLWACVILNRPQAFWEMFKKLCKRGFFAWNRKRIGDEDIYSKDKTPDFFLFRAIAPTIRMLMSRSQFLFITMWPVCFMWDVVWLGLNTVVRTLYPFIDREDTGDDLNFVVWLCGTKYAHDTPAAFIWRNFYLGLRPHATLKYSAKFREAQQGLLGAQTAFNQYFFEDAAPPLNVKATKVIVCL